MIEKKHATIVEKAWGMEEIIANEPTYCGKRMTLKPGWRCSVHRHLLKEETFYVESGYMFLEIGDSWENTVCLELGPGGIIRILPSQWHRFTNVTQQHCIFFEFSTHHDDADVERLEPSGTL